jgi:hypothetical protein
LKGLDIGGRTSGCQYGAWIETFVLDRQNYQLLPETQLATLMADRFGVNLARATIARISQAYAKQCQSFADSVRDQVAKAPVKHMDETGFRIGGKTRWLHIASTMLLTFYRVLLKSLAGLGGAHRPAAQALDSGGASARWPCAAASTRHARVSWRRQYIHAT